MEKSKCCGTKIVYVKDWGNHHDECSKCGLETSYVEEKLKEDPDYKFNKK